MKSLNVNHVTDLIQVFSYYLILYFFGGFGVTSMIKNVEKNVMSSLLMPVNSVQFRWTVGLFNNQTFLKCNMNESFLSDVTIHQCHITTFCICSPLVLLHMVLIFRFIFPPRQFRNHFESQHLELELDFYSYVYLIWLFICIFLGFTGT